MLRNEKKKKEEKREKRGRKREKGNVGEYKKADGLMRFRNFACMHSDLGRWRDMFEEN